MSFDALDEGWEIWSEEQLRMVLAYRSNVFDTQAFPAPCLPTIYVTKGKRGRRPGRERPDPGTDWYVTLYLEPDVNGDEQQYETREDAMTGAVELASRFAAGDIDYRSLYQVPRPEYFDRLDELTGRD